MHCRDKGPVRRTPSGNISANYGARDVLRYGRYDLPENIVHGLSSTRAYSSWNAMMRRCYSSSHKSYEDYGGRGIRVCTDWHNPLLFYCDMGDRPEGWSIERLNPDGDYCPENCIWIPKEEQGYCKRGTVAYRFPALSRTQVQELRRELESQYNKGYHKKTYKRRKLGWWRENFGLKQNPYIYGPMPWKRTSRKYRLQEAIERGWYKPWEK